MTVTFKIRVYSRKMIWKPHTPAFVSNIKITIHTKGIVEDTEFLFSQTTFHQHGPCNNYVYNPWYDNILALVIFKIVIFLIIVSHFRHYSTVIFFFPVNITYIPKTMNSRV